MSKCTFNYARKKSKDFPVKIFNRNSQFPAALRADQLYQIPPKAWKVHIETHLRP